MDRCNETQLHVGKSLILLLSTLGVILSQYSGIGLTGPRLDAITCNM